MSKKLSNVEINVLSNEISKKVNEIKYEKIKSKLEKDDDFKKLEKLNVEIKKLSDSINDININKQTIKSQQPRFFNT